MCFIFYETQNTNMIPVQWLHQFKTINAMHVGFEGEKVNLLHDIIHYLLVNNVWLKW